RYRLHPRARTRRRIRLALLLPVSFSGYGDRFQLFLLQSGIDARQLRLQLLEVVDHILQFMAERIGTSSLIISRTPLIVIHAAVELSKMLADALLSSDHAALFGGNNLR